MNERLKQGLGTLLAVIVGSSVFALAAAPARGEQSAVCHKIGIAIREAALVALAGPDTLTLDAASERRGVLRLHYTAVNTAARHRRISVNWRSGDRAPAGTSLHLQATHVPAGCGTGNREVVVSDRPSPLICDIPSCVTGRGAAGAVLEYRLSIDDASRLLDAEKTTVTLVFTISDDP